jgi:hypothetical protein
MPTNARAIRALSAAARPQRWSAPRGAARSRTDRTVVSFMGANDIAPDAAAEIFVMGRPV